MVERTAMMNALTTAGATLMKYQLDNVFIKSWSISGNNDLPTEEVAFYYNKIAFDY